MPFQDQLRRMEEALADPEVRKAPDAMRSILHPEFIEVGASGRRFDLAQILTLLTEETDFSAYQIEDFTAQELGPNRALVTYRIPPRGNNKPGSYRCSIWVKEEGHWLLLYHQGTRTE